MGNLGSSLVELLFVCVCACVCLSFSTALSSNTGHDHFVVIDLLPHLHAQYKPPLYVPVSWLLPPSYPPDIQRGYRGGRTHIVNIISVRQQASAEMKGACASVLCFMCPPPLQKNTHDCSEPHPDDVIASDVLVDAAAMEARESRQWLWREIICLSCDTVKGAPFRDAKKILL